MPYQNRVSPYGTIIATPARGTFMGNRGILHNEKQEIVRPYAAKAWIICLLDFKGWHRPIMSPRSYTELFFLDEATALAAGHRPCFECRRERAVAFRESWAAGNPEKVTRRKLLVGHIDKVLHEERLTKARYVKDRKKQTHQAELGALPDGAFIELEGEPYLVLGERLFLWTPFRYERPLWRPEDQIVNVLTPPSTVKSLVQGYEPALHTSVFPS